MSKRILIIDDEIKICLAVKEGLEGMGDFNVVFATSGEEGIHAAKKLRPDLIILDIRLPGIDGVEVLRRLKNDIGTIAIPVIMLTAILEDTAKVECSREYAELYLEKPIDLKVLKTKIEEIFRRLDGIKSGN